MFFIKKAKSIDAQHDVVQHDKEGKLHGMQKKLRLLILKPVKASSCIKPSIYVITTTESGMVPISIMIQEVTRMFGSIAIILLMLLK